VVMGRMSEVFRAFRNCSSLEVSWSQLAASIFTTNPLGCLNTHSTPSRAVSWAGKVVCFVSANSVWSILIRGSSSNLNPVLLRFSRILFVADVSTFNVCGSIITP